MGKIAFVFAGQGAQRAGMGRELCESSPAAGKVFEMAEKLRSGTALQCFEGTQEELCRTVNTQPCLYTVNLASAAAAMENGIKAAGAAGFSLGELSAVAFGGLMSYSDGLLLTQQRGILMDSCGVKHPSGMVAILRLPAVVVQDICATVKGAYPVNYNSPEQTVAACSLETMDKLTAAVTAAGGRCMALPVSGGFHSPYMDEAASGLWELLSVKELSMPAIPVYANLTGKPYGSRGGELLSAQVNHPVLWQKTIENMMNDGFDTFIEMGVGKTLSGIIKKISPDAAVYNVCDNASLENTLAGVRTA